MEQYDTLTSSDGKTQYVLSAWYSHVATQLEPERWYTEAEIEALGMRFIVTTATDRKPRKWKLTTWSRANIESGAWRKPA